LLLLLLGLHGAFSMHLDLTILTILTNSSIVLLVLAGAGR
jgi:hypothetical protein